MKLPTPRLTRTLQLAVERQQPPRAGDGATKLRYAHQGGSNPPVVVIHGTSQLEVPDAYRRYLEHFFADAFKLRGTPLRIQFRGGCQPLRRRPRTPLNGRARIRGLPAGARCGRRRQKRSRSHDEQQRGKCYKTRS